MELARQLTALAPVYAVSGNHEARLPNYESEIAPALTAAGVVVLDDRQVVLERQGSQLGLLGLSDPDFGRYQDMTSQIQQLAAANGQTFSLLLCHRPEYASCYQQAGVDLVFCGHAHGGQFRLPGLGGLFAPGQGFLPRYTAGAYSLDATTKMCIRDSAKYRLGYFLWVEAGQRAAGPYRCLRRRLPLTMFLATSFWCRARYAPKKKWRCYIFQLVLPAKVDFPSEFF